MSCSFLLHVTFLPVFFSVAVTMRTPWSKLVGRKRTPGVARSNSHRLLPRLQLLPRPLTPRRPHPPSHKLRPRPPQPHRTLSTSRERWHAAASRRGAGERRYAQTFTKTTYQTVIVNGSLLTLLVLFSSADGRHH